MHLPGINGGSRELLPNCPCFQCLQALISPGSRLPVCGAKNAKTPGSSETLGLTTLGDAAGRGMRTVCLERTWEVGWIAFQDLEIAKTSLRKS